MTVAILQFTIIPVVADLNRSHATNPDWPAHARFHVVTQVLTTSALGLVALYCLWGGRFEPIVGVCIAMTISLTVLGGFFASAISTRYYGGQMTATRGVAAWRLGRIDGNAMNFGLSLVLLLGGRLLVMSVIS